MISPRSAVGAQESKGSIQTDMAFLSLSHQMPSQLAVQRAAGSLGKLPLPKSRRVFVQSKQ